MLLSFSTGFAVTFFLLICKSFATESPNILVIILSQENSYHKQNAEKLKENIIEQADSLRVLNKITVNILPNDETHIGYWTIVPIFPWILESYGNYYSWIFFCEDVTIVNLKRLIFSLQKSNVFEKSWMGFGLMDEEPTIIHHFAFYENPSIFKYPLMSAGLAITTSLLTEVTLEKALDNNKESEFSIDASHELALYIGEHYPLIHEPSLFCDNPGDDCASYPNKIKYCSPTLLADEIYFAVKTCHKYHNNRVPFIKQTWGKEAKYLKFFSDTKNESIPTTHVGVKNTERGHCLKTFKILEMALEEVTSKLQSIKWVILADDDTILSVNRLLSHLSCYSHDIVIGERYGYKIHDGHGYNYLTGGGGIAFGISTLYKLVNSCKCPQIDSPDDMVLGLCMSALNIPMTHSPLFHQARPMDYASSYLNIGSPVSFHKHWNVDPMMVYEKWLSSSTHEVIHTEL